MTMRRLALPTVALSVMLVAAFLLTIQTSSAQEVSDSDRLHLWNKCRPTDLMVANIPDNAAAIGLTKDKIIVAARSRLRAARIYSESRTETGYSHLVIQVKMTGLVFLMSLEYRKAVMDLATKLSGGAATWSIGALGQHGHNAVFVSSHAEELVDTFIDEYLRVNQEACEKR